MTAALRSFSATPSHTATQPGQAAPRRRTVPATTAGIFALAVAGFTPVAPAADQEQDANDAPQRLEPITVEAAGASAHGPVSGYVATRSATATKTDAPLIETPRSLSVITRAQLEAQGASDLGEALRYTPGVQGEPFGVEPRLTFLRLRGFDVSTTGLYRDGLKLANPGFLVSYGFIPYGAERIEVLRGPASVLYGQISPGGLVNYVSKRPTAIPHREVRLEAGDFDHRQISFDFSGPLGDDDTLLYRLTGLTRNSDTQVDFVEDDRILLAPSITWRASESTRWTLLTRYQETDTRSSQALPAAGTILPNPNGEVPADRFTGEPAVDRYERDLWSLTSLFSHRFNEVLSFQQKSRYYRVDLTDISVYSSSVAPDQRTINRARFDNLSELGSLTLDNQLQLNVATGALQHSLVAGLDYQRIGVDALQKFGGAPPLDIFAPDYGAAAPAGPVFRDDDIVQQQIGLYLQDRIALGGLIVSLGARHDWAESETDSALAAASDTSQDDSAFTGSAGVLYHFDNGLAPYASYATSFLPSLGTDAAGNEFEPETAEQYELGVKYQPPGTNAFVTLALFELTREDYVQFDPATFLPEQTGQVRSRGVEVGANASFDFGLDLIATYTYLDVEITETNDPAELGMRPSQTPQELASLWADYSIPKGALAGLGFGAGVRYVGSSFAANANNLKSPGYTLVDAVLHYAWDDFRVQLNAKNLLDEDYFTGAFIRSGSAFAVAGLERTVTASLTFNW